MERTILLTESPTFEMIQSHFDRKCTDKITFNYNGHTVKAYRKIVYSRNQIKSNLLHIYIMAKHNYWIHYVEDKNKNTFNYKDYEGPIF